MGFIAITDEDYEMKTLYLECKMGVAGDMLSAALLELCPDKEDILKTLNGMGLSGVSFSLDKSEKCGIVGSHLSVVVDGEEEESVDVEHEHSHSHEHNHEHSHDHDHEHSHFHEHSHEHAHEHDHPHDHDHDHSHEHGHGHVRGMSEIETIVSQLSIDETVKTDVLSVYKLIAEAESKVHGMEVTKIHFHEVGKLDAIADITAACLLIRKLSPDKIIASPIHVGSGQVKCAHGILPVPTPATALLLKGVPSYSGDIRGELCTPTGAAILKHFVSEFGPQPVMTIENIGYGMGKKDFPQANCVRAILGESVAATSAEAGIGDGKTDTIAELVCNLDDMTPEEIGFATERLMEEGALDVFTAGISMKKNRPGVMLTVLCKENQKEKFVRHIFKYTTTIGIRENICSRYILNRAEDEINLDGEKVRVKKASGYGVSRQKAEYEDLAKIAREKNVSIRDIISSQNLK